jgi:tetratricopeptide (TPR) repeat protein
MSSASGPPTAETVSALLESAVRALRSGRPADAIAPLRQAALLRPQAAVIHHDLGLACLETGLVQESVNAFRRAVASDPGSTDAHFHLGVGLERLGDVGAALVAYHRATELNPSLTEAWYRAGALVHTLGHRDEAIACFKRAAESGSKTRFGRLGAARALLTAGREREGERALRLCVAADPENPLAHDLLGNLLAEAGHFEEAIACFTRAIALAPLLAGSYYDLVRCRRIIPADAALVAQMETALGTPGLDVEPRIRIHLALGKAADDLGEYERAMRHFDAADAVRRAGAAFPSEQFDREVTQLIEQTTPDLVARAPRLGTANPLPVLIIGMPRSGTTLVEQIISSHPKVRAGGELNFWPSCGARWHEAGAAGNEGNEGNERKFLREAALNYLRVLRGIGPKAVRVTDKNPFNFLWAGLIHLALPRATIIHCRRAAIDTALSIHQTLFHPSLAFPTGGDKLVAYFRSYQRLTDHWRRLLPPERFIEVDYEELTRDPDPVIRGLIAACGLSWHDACLRPDRNPQSVKTASRWQTRQPIYRASVERWRHYEPYLGSLRPLLRVASAAPSPGGSTPSSSGSLGAPRAAGMRPDAPMKLGMRLKSRP